MATGALPAWLPLVNRVVRTLARLGLERGPQILTVPGRNSGKPRSTPVTPFTLDGRRYVVAALPQSDWARNVRAAGRGTLAVGRRATPVDLPEITDPEQRRLVVRAVPTLVPTGVPFYVRLGLVTAADPDQFAAISDQVAVFEIRPVTG